jgi:hypothetical protein
MTEDVCIDVSRWIGRVLEVIDRQAREAKAEVELTWGSVDSMNACEELAADWRRLADQLRGLWRHADRLAARHRCLVDRVAPRSAEKEVAHE